MIRAQNSGLSFYRFENLLQFPEVEHGIFCRSGGVSLPPRNSLNVGFGIGDNPHHVLENRRKIARCFSFRELVYVRQVHGTGVLHPELETKGSGREAGTGPAPADAITTRSGGLGLAIQVADCQAVMIYDAVRKAAANIHAGWRGSIGNIIGKTLNVMKTRYGTHAADVAAGIGPSLGPCCAQFVHFRSEIPEKFWGYKDGRDCFDFWAVSTDQLRAAGVRSERIEVSGMCTRCRSDLFFSYRAEGVTGRLAAVIGLKE